METIINDNKMELLALKNIVNSLQKKNEELKEEKEKVNEKISFLAKINHVIGDWKVVHDIDIFLKYYILHFKDYSEAR